MIQERGQQEAVGEKSVFTAAVTKDARATCRFPSMTGAGTSPMSHSGSIKASAGTDVVV